MSRSVLLSAALLATVAWAQPSTYQVPIVARTPSTNPLPGSGSVDVTLWLPDPGVDVGQSILFGTSQGTSTAYRLSNLGSASVSGLPVSVGALATAPGVLVAGTRRTLVAITTAGTVVLGTIENGTFVSRGPSGPLAGSPPIALAAAPDGGATLLVSDATGTQLTRWDLDLSQSSARATPSLSAPGTPAGEPATELLLAPDLNGSTAIVGTSLGSLYQLDPRLDAGRPTLIDAALLSQGRLAAPVTGLALYRGQNAAYLLVTSGQGLTVYDLLQATPTTTAFRLQPKDSSGTLGNPSGAAVTNLPAGAALPAGVVALGDPTGRGLVLVRWDQIATTVDGGLVIDTTTDPRGSNGGGGPDAGADAGDSGTPGGGAPEAGGGPLTPGIPVSTSSGCTAAAGGPGLAVLALLALLLPRRRQRR